MNRKLTTIWAFEKRYFHTGIVRFTISIGFLKINLTYSESAIYYRCDLITIRAFITFHKITVLSPTFYHKMTGKDKQQKPMNNYRTDSPILTGRRKK